ncbi:YbaK/EbsC protein [Anaerohalosphaera lusitana]|uniref:YbaK/EbsC protein n=1 Tax=Anaerohalosphaera lusitana TaxID=1936003 RepID=A0A1U9NPQ8_9BACT|nr:YbaK/EbsC family protein [Anaerohalosphaera lusitana]AQT69911.1 YbaK/EbsC protein [Anaerohalosphaera lusitana]
MQLMDYLDKIHAKYEVKQHRPTFTAQEMAAEEHVPGIHVAKPVVIKADESYYMCVLPASYKIDFDMLKRQLGAESLELAEEGEMAKMFGDCALGAEPPFGNLYGLTTFVDETLAEEDYIVFQGGTHENAIRMEMSEYKRLAKPTVMSFSYPSQ